MNNHNSDDPSQNSPSETADRGGRRKIIQTDRPIRRRHDKVFKGETPQMNGNVFQTHSKQSSKTQFNYTLDALRIYASTAHKTDIEALNMLFTQLQTPCLHRPIEPKKELMNQRTRKDS